MSTPVSTLSPSYSSHRIGMKSVCLKLVALLSFACALLAATSGAQAQTGQLIPLGTVAPGAYSTPLSVRVESLGQTLQPGDEIVLTGTYTFVPNGFVYDAVGRVGSFIGGGTSAAPLSMMPGLILIEGDSVTHRYRFRVLDATASYRISLQQLGLEFLMGEREASGMVRGAIQMALQRQATPVVAEPSEPFWPKTFTTSIVRHANNGTSPLKIWGPLAASAFFLPLFFLAGWSVRRRRDPLQVSLRQARRAKKAIDREVAELGLAFKAVGSSAARIIEACERSVTHHQGIGVAIARINKLGAKAATKEMQRLEKRQQQVLEHLSRLVNNLEATAARLASQNADRQLSFHATPMDEELQAALGAEFEVESELDSDSAGGSTSEVSPDPSLIPPASIDLDGVSDAQG